VEVQFQVLQAVVVVVQVVQDQTEPVPQVVQGALVSSARSQEHLATTVVVVAVGQELHAEAEQESQ
jgi:hypothetical protein